MRILLALSSACVLSAQQYTISTFAGGAPPITPVPALKSSIVLNTGFSTEAGSVYFSGANCVFKIDANGILTRVAGDSRVGAFVEGVAATSAEFSTAGAVTADHLGNIYVVDRNFASGQIGDTLRKIAPDGTMTTVLTNLNIQSRDNSVRLAVDPSSNLFVVDGTYIRKYSTDGKLTTVAGSASHSFSGDGGPALQAGLGTVQSIAVDGAGNLYIAEASYDDFDDDTVDVHIRIVTPDGIIKTLAGSGSMGFSGDGGPASAAQLSGWFPALAIDGTGALLIVDAGNHTIRRVTPDGMIASLQTLDQSGCFLQGSGPYICAGDIATDAAGRIYIVGQYNGYVQLLGADGSLTTIAGVGPASIGDGGQATSAILASPLGIAIDPAHNVYVADEQHNRIRKISATGTITTAAGNGVPRPPGIPLNDDGGLALNAELACGPQFSCKGMAFDSAGNFFFSDGERVRKVTPTGIITTAAMVAAQGLASDGKNLYITDFGNNRVLKLDELGALEVVAGNGSLGHSGDGGQAIYAQLEVPVDVAVDGAGNLYIAENYESHIRKVTPDGTISSIAGGGTDRSDGILATSSVLDRNLGIAADHDGNVYIAEYASSRIRKISTNGIITTIAGGVCKSTSINPCSGYIGDGGAATSAQLSGPARLAVDSDGTVYISDFGNNAVRVLRPIR